MDEQVASIMAVLGLVGGLLLLATVARRYQAYKAETRAKVRGLLAVVTSTRGLLGELQGLAIARDSRVLLRLEVLDLYREIRVLAPGHPEVKDLVAKAAADLKAEGPGGGGVGTIADAAELARLVAAADALSAWLRGRGRGRAKAEEIRRLLQEVGERRAEANARYRLVTAIRRRREGDEAGARRLLTELMHLLRRNGPNTGFVRRLYDEAHTLLTDAPTAAMSTQDEERAAGGAVRA